MAPLLSRMIRARRPTDPRQATVAEPQSPAHADEATPTPAPVAADAVPEPPAPPAPTFDVEPPAPLPLAAPDIDPEPLAASFQLNPPLPGGWNAPGPPSKRSTATAPKKKTTPGGRAALRPRKPRTSSPRGEIRMKPKPHHAPKVEPPHAAAVHANGTNGHRAADARTARPSAANPASPSPQASLAWLRTLAKRVHPAGLHLLLGYYRRLGWIPAGPYAWLKELASGVARQAPNMTFDSLRVEPERLIDIHMASHRALARIFPAARQSEAAPVPVVRLVMPRVRAR